MRTKQIIPGFNNTQKFRFILTANSGEDFGMTITIQQMLEQFATTNARVSVFSAMAKLAMDRIAAKAKGEPLPTGIVVAAQGFRQVQVDIH
jgi:hypothetical protein